jgi:hypothetical protein
MEVQRGDTWLQLGQLFQSDIASVFSLQKIFMQCRSRVENRDLIEFKMGELDMVLHACNSRTQEAEVGES